LNGGAGIDTLNVTVGAANTYSLSSVSNVENVVGAFSAAGTLTLLGATGINSISANASTAPAIYSNIASTAVGLTVSNTDQNATFTFGTAAVAGLADTATLTLSNVTAGTVTIAGVETLNVVSTGGSNALTALTAANARTINISGDQTLNLGTNTVATTINSTNTLGVALTSTNAAAVTIAAGAGNDALTITDAGGVNNSVVGGAGNDTVTFTQNLSNADTVAGGDGTDTLVGVSADLVGLTVPTTATITGFEQITVSNALGGNLTTANVQAGIQVVTLAAALAADRTITMEAGSRTVTQTATQAAVLTVNDTGSATTDTLTLNIDSAVGAVDVLSNAVVVGGFETVNIVTTTTAAATQQLDNITVTPDSISAAVINFSGNNTVTTGVITATNAASGTVNASGLTGTATFTNAGATVGITSITGSANNDTIVGSATATTIDGGAGRDNITGGAGNDVITGGAGNDTVDGAGSNDNISGGAGEDSITAGAGSDTIDGGADNDTIIFGAELATGDSIDGGDGTDTLSVTQTSLGVIGAYSISTATTLNNRISNVERVIVSDALQNNAAFDVTRLDGISYITLAAGYNGAGAGGDANEELSGLANGATVVTNGAADNAADVLTLSLAESTGASDSVNFTMTRAADADYGNLTVAGIETVNITVNEATADATVRVATLGLSIGRSDGTNTRAVTLNISGTETVTLDTVVGADVINASGITGSARLIMTNTTGSALAQTITGGAGADNIYAGAGADSIVGGAGTDSLFGGTGVDTIDGGTGADTIFGGAGNDVITLTEAVAAVDDVVINYSGVGTEMDIITGFVTGAAGDEIQLSFGALETAGTSGIHTAATNFQQLDANTDVTAAAAAVQVLTGAATAGANNVFVLRGTNLLTTGEVEDALETGGAFALTVSGTDAHIEAADAFVVVYSDGADSYVATARVVTDPGTNTAFAAGALAVTNVAKLVGISTIGATTFSAANFEWIA
jgi:Ca2+-binding RTX toxin-like protein